MTKYDLIVIGSGPAGGAAAFVAARAGLRVALIDRQKFPRDKLCGGGVTGRALASYRGIFGADPPDMDRVTSFEFHAHGRNLGRLDDMPPLYLTTRLALDNAIHTGAVAAGAQAITARLHRILPDECAVVLAGGDVLRARLLIGADGINSNVARAIFGHSFDPARVGFALETEAAPLPPGVPVRIDFGAAAWGYGWVFPKRGSATVGVGGVMARNPGIKAAMSAYLDITDSAGNAPVKGHHLPFGEFRRVPGKGCVLLAGDAAGLVDPVTGEGIGHALESGAAAARAAVEALREDRPGRALPRYRRALRPIHHSLWQARALRQVIHAPALRPAFLRAFSRSGSLRQMFLRQLAGEIEYPAVSRAVLRRLPRLVTRAVRMGFGRRSDP